MSEIDYEDAILALLETYAESFQGRGLKVKGLIARAKQQAIEGEIKSVVRDKGVAAELRLPILLRYCQEWANALGGLYDRTGGSGAEVKRLRLAQEVRELLEKQVGS